MNEPYDRMETERCNGNGVLDDTQKEAGYLPRLGAELKRGIARNDKDQIGVDAADCNEIE